MEQTKTLLKSKTAGGVAVAVIGYVLNQLGYVPTGEDIATLGQYLDDALVLGGAGLALYGRIKATKRIS